MATQNTVYHDQMIEDIKDYIKESVNLSDFTDRDELETKLYDDLWIEDSVTGNASGSYTFSREAAKENIVSNIDLVGEMISEFGISAEEVGNHFINEDWEWFDVSIRCYLLGQMINEVLDDLEKSGELPFSE